jgi:8-oxo-dGTP pyrophosphatase MutT (NUDIX family)
MGRTRFPACSILPDEKHVDAAVRELHEETGLVLTFDDLTILSYNPVRVSLPEAKHQLGYVFSAFVPVPFISTDIRSHAKLIQA